MRAANLSRNTHGSVGVTRHVDIQYVHKPSTNYLSSVEDVQELLAGSTSGNRLLDGALCLSLLSEQLLSSEGLGVRVESEENSLVSEGVLLLGEGS